MIKKQILAVVVGVGSIIVISILAYQQFTLSLDEQQANSITRSEVLLKKQGVKPSDAIGAEQVTTMPIPETIDGITADIESETTLDTSALDEEVTGEIRDINEDSASVNNLGTSYDESNL